ncbi:hypothetical protein [Flavobacterium sp. IB48]|uniref:hypothetical protein n=1 Tax=Flavobacterium sp. IB48 TaxID=2779375 RepID=UPI0018E6E98A|nr:hypothetical protein [Flavobacterium sp. IB48]MBJ2126700.1 hypothetical protein [Flavobacterium sp. IB48]
MNEDNQKYPAKIIAESTESFLRFRQGVQRSEMLISYVEVGSKLILKNNNEAKEYLKGIYNHVYNPEIVKKSLNSNIDTFLNIGFYEEHLCSMIYVSSIDNLTIYFKEILSEVVSTKPQILKSQETERLDFILQHESLSDLINAISDKKIEELFYKGIEDIEKFFQSRLGIDIFKTKLAKENINKLIKQRNLTVHNRRKISKDFARQFPDLKNSIGQYLIFDFEYVSTINLQLFNFVASIDEEISKKFELKKVNL